MKHRTVDYDVQEVQPGLWRWNIYPIGQSVQGPPAFRSREQAVAACIEEINNGIERTRRATPVGKRTIISSQMVAVHETPFRLPTSSLLVAAPECPQASRPEECVRHSCPPVGS